MDLTTNQPNPQVAVWLPLVSLRPNRARILMPYERNTRFWLGNVCGPGTRPDFERKATGGVWTVSRKHFGKVVQALADRYGSCLAMQDFLSQVKCTAACHEAKSDVSMCECSCRGTAHGAHRPMGRHDWTDGTMYVYNEMHRQCWIVERAHAEAVAA